MNGIDFLADTNFIIHVNEGNPLVKSFLDFNFGISFISEIELLGAFSISKLKKSQIQSIIDDCKVLEMNTEIKQSCIKIRQQYRLKVPDTIIAATAIAWNVPLVTSDLDFEKIKEIELIFIDKNNE